MLVCYCLLFCFIVCSKPEKKWEAWYCLTGKQVLFNQLFLWHFLALLFTLFPILPSCLALVNPSLLLCPCPRFLTFDSALWPIQLNQGHLVWDHPHSLVGSPVDTQLKATRAPSWWFKIKVLLGQNAIRETVESVLGRDRVTPCGMKENRAITGTALDLKTSGFGN